MYFSYAVCTHFCSSRASCVRHTVVLFALKIPFYSISSVICLSQSSPPFPMKQSVHPLSSRGHGCINTSFFTRFTHLNTEFLNRYFLHTQYVSANVHRYHHFITGASAGPRCGAWLENLQISEPLER